MGHRWKSSTLRTTLNPSHVTKEQAFSECLLCDRFCPGLEIKEKKPELALIHNEVSLEVEVDPERNSIT